MRDQWKSNKEYFTAITIVVLSFIVRQSDRKQGFYRFSFYHLLIDDKSLHIFNFFRAFLLRFSILFLNWHPIHWIHTFLSLRWMLDFSFFFFFALRFVKQWKTRVSMNIKNNNSSFYYIAYIFVCHSQCLPAVYENKGLQYKITETMEW